MKPRERVEAALSHRKPDRCPFFVSFTPEFAERLKEDLSLIDSSEAHNPHGGGNLYQLETALGQDLLVTSIGWANSYYQEPGDYADEWGIGWRSVQYQTAYGEGRYTEVVDHPLADDEAVESYQSPDPERPELYLEARKTLDKFQDDYYICGGVVTTIFETAWALRGLDRLLLDLLEKPELTEKILDIPFKYHLTVARKLAKMGADMIWLGDDVGMQNSMLISPDTWRKFLKPRMARLIREIKEINPDLKVAYHSDGDIYPIIPDLIEIGLDVLNPIQPKSLDPEELNREFGDQLCFWGTIDEQQTLPFGSPDDVRDEVRNRLKTIGKNGGLIIGPTHHLQLDTPLENFWAMIDTIKNTPPG